MVSKTRRKAQLVSASGQPGALATALFQEIDGRDAKTVVGMRWPLTHLANRRIVFSSGAKDSCERRFTRHA
jgi:hypothetical protein